MRRPYRPRRAGNALLPYALLAPAGLMLLLFSLYPLLSGIHYSFTNIGWIGDKFKFVGLGNYRQILTGNIGAANFFKTAALQSFYWTVAVVFRQLVMGLFTALILNERFPGRVFFRTAVDGANRHADRHPHADLAMDVRSLLWAHQLLSPLSRPSKRSESVGGAAEFPLMAPHCRRHLAGISLHVHDAAVGVARHTRRAL